MTNKLAQGGQFRPNERCELYGEIEAAQIIRFGKTRNGTQRYWCKRCGRTFTETHGTVFYRRQASRETILETLALLVEGVRISSISRAKGIKEDTILDWLRAAARQAAEIEEALLKDYRISQAQIDGLWNYVGHKGHKGGVESDEQGEFWRCTLMEVDTRLRVRHGIGPTETDASIELLHQLKRRGHPAAPPPLVSDGWGGHREALIEVYGHVPEYSGRGRPPSRKQPSEEWQYLQIVKQRDKGRVMGMELRVIFGHLEQILAELELHTAYVERTWHVMSKPYG